MKFTQQNVDANFALVHDLANAQELGGLMAEVAQNAQVWEVELTTAVLGDTYIGVSAWPVTGANPISHPCHPDIGDCAARATAIVVLAACNLIKPETLS